VLVDKGYPSKGNRAWLRQHDIAATIPERDDQIAHHRKKPGRPIDFGPEQKERYKERRVVERCFNKLKQWRGIAMRSDKTARSYHAALCLAATLHWLNTGFNKTPCSVSEMCLESGWGLVLLGAALKRSSQTGAAVTARSTSGRHRAWCRRAASPGVLTSH
jgi:transposase